MAVGPFAEVARTIPRPNHYDKVSLTNITDLDVLDGLPFRTRADDPGLEYLYPAQRDMLTQEEGGWMFLDNIVDNPRNVVWGIAPDMLEPLSGFVSLTMPEVGESLGLTVVLAPEARGKGMGTLGAAGAIAIGLQRDVLHQINDAFPEQPKDIYTEIHPGNVGSRQMCARLGFEHEGQRWEQKLGKAGLFVDTYRLVPGMLSRQVTVGHQVSFVTRRHATAAGETYMVDMFI